MNKKEWLQEEIGNILYNANLRGDINSSEGNILYDEIVSKVDQLAEECEPLSKEWHLKVYKELKEYSTLTEASFDLYWNSIADDVEIEEVKENWLRSKIVIDKPEIPQYIADYIDEMKEEGHFLQQIMSYIHDDYKWDELDEIGEWIVDNERKFVEAWYYGFKIKNK